MITFCQVLLGTPARVNTLWISVDSTTPDSLPSRSKGSTSCVLDTSATPR